MFDISHWSAIQRKIESPELREQCEIHKHQIEKYCRTLNPKTAKEYPKAFGDRTQLLHMLLLAGIEERPPTVLGVGLKTHPSDNARHSVDHEPRLAFWMFGNQSTDQAGITAAITGFFYQKKISLLPSGNFELPNGGFFSWYYMQLETGVDRKTTERGFKNAMNQFFDGDKVATEFATTYNEVNEILDVYENSDGGNWIDGYEPIFRIASDVESLLKRSPDELYGQDERMQEKHAESNRTEQGMSRFTFPVVQKARIQLWSELKISSSEEEAEAVADASRILGTVRRLKFWKLLGNQEQSVAELEEKSDQEFEKKLEQTEVSKLLKVFRDANLVVSRKSGRHRFYRRNQAMIALKRLVEEENDE